MAPATQMQELGATLRNHRNGKGWSLAAAASQANLSPSFISLVENGKTDITIGRLNRLLNAYGLNIADLYSPTASSVSSLDPPAPVEFPSDLRTRFESPTEGVEYLMYETKANFIPVRVTLSPDGHWADPSSHELAEFGFVLHGRIRATVGARVYTLRAGDGFDVPPKTPHMLKNTGQDTAELFVVLQPTASESNQDS